MLTPKFGILLIWGVANGAKERVEFWHDENGVIALFDSQQEAMQYYFDNLVALRWQYSQVYIVYITEAEELTYQRKTKV